MTTTYGSGPPLGEVLAVIGLALLGLALLALIIWLLVRMRAAPAGVFAGAVIFLGLCVFAWPQTYSISQRYYNGHRLRYNTSREYRIGPIFDDARPAHLPTLMGYAMLSGVIGLTVWAIKSPRNPRKPRTGSATPSATLGPPTTSPPSKATGTNPRP